MKGLGLLTSKPEILVRCPKSFGVKTRTHYSAWLNSKREVELGPDGTPWATNQVRWFIEKGDVLVPGKEVTGTYDCLFEMPESSLPNRKKKQTTPPDVFREIIFIASEADRPPIKFSDIKRGELLPRARRQRRRGMSLTARYRPRSHQTHPV